MRIFKVLAVTIQCGRNWSGHGFLRKAAHSISGVRLCDSGWMTAWSVLFAIVLLPGCAGYHLGPVAGVTRGMETIEVQPFNNQTLQPQLGDVVTESLRERLQTDGTYRLATRRDNGDIVVTGFIHQYLRQGLGFLGTDITTPDNFRIDIVAHVTARERVSGKLILNKDVKGHTFVHVGPDLASAERQAMPVLAEDLAMNITEMLTEGTW